MTRPRLAAAVALLLLASACGRIGPPVRASQPQRVDGAGVAPATGAAPSTEPGAAEDEKKKEEKR